MAKEPIYISKKGSVIYTHKGDAGTLYHVCVDSLYIYCNDYIAAKKQLQRLENLKISSTKRSIKLAQTESKKLRKLVEKAAAPYLVKNADKSFERMSKQS